MTTDYTHNFSVGDCLDVRLVWILFHLANYTSVDKMTLPHSSQLGAQLTENVYLLKFEVKSSNRVDPLGRSPAYEVPLRATEGW